ncbi:hypothetical protein [Rhizobium sp. MHM7A]|uniref:hypothetical protein n=1 Tax=Rhizobium sp. MHM7A TaxID=2583233 RepID=UPI001FEFB713|nr:hypothetical protein [Rhizobium sp. MHM7A]
MDAINASTAPVIEEYARLTHAVNKAITLILTMAAVGVLTFVSFAPTEQRLKTDALINQENISHG